MTIPLSPVTTTVPPPLAASVTSRRSRGWLWPTAVAVILIASMASNIGVMMVANSDPAFAVEPDYYGKAVRWDDQMAQDRTNLALGWQVSGGLSLSRDAEVGRLTVVLQDSSGLPLEGATVSAEAMHNARSADRREVALVPMRPGVYWAPIDAKRPGQWEIRVSAIRGEAHFTHSLRVDAQ